MIVTEENHPLVSVIVPIYNVEKYIYRCVNSLLNQSFEDYEIILVDDGSPDACGRICDAISQENGKVHTIHKANGGLSDARNVGVESALAEYIIFVDSDDYVDTDYISELWRLHEQYNTEVCFSASVKEDETGKLLSSRFKYRSQRVSRRQAQSMILEGETIGTSAWGKLINKALCLKYPFPKGKLMEDLRTVFFILNDVDEVGVSTKQTYHYIQHEGSILHNKYGIDEAKEYLDLGKMFIDISEDSKIKNAALGRLLYIAGVIVRGASDTKKKNIFSLVRRYIRPHLIYILAQKDISLSKKARAILYSSPNRVIELAEKL